MLDYYLTGGSSPVTSLSSYIKCIETLKVFGYNKNIPMKYF